MCKGVPGSSLYYITIKVILVIDYTNADWVGSPLDRCFTLGYYVLVMLSLGKVRSLRLWLEYQAMTLVTCKLIIWIKQLIQELNL